MKDTFPDPASYEGWLRFSRPQPPVAADLSQSSTSQADTGCRSLQQALLHASHFSQNFPKKVQPRVYGGSRMHQGIQSSRTHAMPSSRTTRGMPTRSSPVRPCLAQAADSKGGGACPCTHHQAVSNGCALGSNQQPALIPSMLTHTWLIAPASVPRPWI